VQAAWNSKTRGVLLASPSNPTGTSIAPGELRRIHGVVQERGGVTMIDEIYLGLSYEKAFGQTALAIDDSVISINSFSKYFNMTGWRLGWMVVPDAMVPVVERLTQNLFICASTVSQLAAMACFEPESIAEYERRRTEFKARRDYFIPELQALGLAVPVMPDGAFYAWADCTNACEKLGVQGSWDFAYEVMRRAHVAVTPGRDFGTFDPQRFVRLSTAHSMAQLQESVARLRGLLG
jgi:Aspartate/tyrosine/aromatic aminotransferase